MNLLEIAKRMAELDIQVIKLDKLGRIVYISYLNCKQGYKETVDTKDTSETSFYEPKDMDYEVLYPFETESQPEDIYDDPDMWPDGVRPSLKKEE